ncbi:hypothetical protein [Lactococcus phage 1358]|uniref:Uncharacterized protein n=1 Tax=Lactococcus phage 1358 TaxID=741942 RepID=D3W0H1_9CAUD|nr:hypothetical protein ABG43_gp40 [Lactococcus phage 1358]ADD25737.1 hypothetical protein [Lactococcus phage 1358]
MSNEQNELINVLMGNRNNGMIKAIREAHEIGAEIDIQALHGGLPANVKTQYDRNFVSGDYISAVVDKLEAMGYDTAVEGHVMLKHITQLIATKREKGADR